MEGSLKGYVNNLTNLKRKVGQVVPIIAMLLFTAFEITARITLGRTSGYMQNSGKVWIVDY